MSVVVIAGGAGEIGRVLAQRYAAEGNEVIIVDRDSSAHELAHSIGGKAYVLDATVPESLSDLQQITRVDILINCVGSWPLIALDDLNPQRWRELVDINLNSAYSIIWACRNALRAASGSVVNIASAIAFKGHAEMAYYSAAKAGVMGMTRSLALALGPDSVCVNAVAPGLVETEINRSTWSDEDRARFLASRALPITLSVEDVVSSVCFLASPEARAITGQSLVVDGGTVMH